LQSCSLDVNDSVWHSDGTIEVNEGIVHGGVKFPITSFADEDQRGLYLENVVYLALVDKAYHLCISAIDHRVWKFVHAYELIQIAIQQIYLVYSISLLLESLVVNPCKVFTG